ncbi:MAG: hypothetical protein LLG97_04945 [Deltaproteobacteria bacterium]|nr:hypothetical protein [Deltaproteobacteria bacterium]
MNDLEIILILVGVVFLFFALLSVPFLIQIWRTAKGLAQTLEILNRDLPAIMQNLEEITTNINRTTTTVSREVAEISLTLRKVQGVVGVMLGVAEVLRRRVNFPLARRVMTVLAVAKGVRTFAGVMMGRDPGRPGCGKQ